MDIVAENKGTRRHYHIEDRVEAGLVLKGSEVKALRARSVNLNKSYAQEHLDGFYLVNAHIGAYAPAADGGHLPRRPRKLLLNKRQQIKLSQEVKQSGMTLVPIKIYFNESGFAKVELGLARGKQAHDKRTDLRKKEWERRKERLLKNRAG
jgi:SsrA-binding protein